MHTEEDDPLRCGGVVRPQEKNEEEGMETESGRNGVDLREDAAPARRGQYLREGLGSAMERNCTGWDTLIYWVITDLGAREARGVWAFSPAPWSFESSQNGAEEYR